MNRESGRGRSSPAIRPHPAPQEFPSFTLRATARGSRIGDRTVRYDATYFLYAAPRWQTSLQAFETGAGIGHERNCGTLTSPRDIETSEQYDSLKTVLRAHRVGGGNVGRRLVAFSDETTTADDRGYQF